MQTAERPKLKVQEQGGAPARGPGTMVSFYYHDARARPCFFTAHFFPVTLYILIACFFEPLKHVSVRFWCVTSQSFQNIPT
jgi:hypothetical protein